MAWRVTPDEYMSRLLMPKSWTIAKMRNTTTNQEGIALWCAKGKKALLELPMVGKNVPTAAPKVMIRISGTAVARKTHPTIPLLDVSGGQ
jgi:hypothetical protein